jgi:trigger factor
MKVEKKDLGKSQIELSVVVPFKDLKPYLEKGAVKISKEVKVDGFRAGKIPYDVLKQKIGEMAIYEEAARIVIDKTIEKVIKENIKDQGVGQPKVDIVKLAPDNDMEYKIVMSILPKVTLGKYKDLKIKKNKIKVDEKEIKAKLKELQESRAVEVASDNKVKDGDKVLVDIEMFQEKVPVEGGQSKGTAVIVGKDYIVPGFDKNLLEHKKNDKVKFSLPYPENHYMKNLAGKRVDFVVKINDVFDRQVPELSDDIAKAFGMKDLEDLKKNLKINLGEQKEREDSGRVEKEILESIIKKATFEEIPEILVDHEAKTMLAELEQGVTSQGAKFEDYLTSIGKTKNQITLEMLPEAIKRVKVSLLIREISTIEKIEVTEAEVEKNIADMKKQYAGEKNIEARVNSPEYKKYITNVLSSRKMVDKLKEWNITK